MFNASRLSLARRRRRLSKKLLAETLDLDQKTIIRYESGEVSPPAANVAAIARVLDFPEKFFDGMDLDEPSVESASFRSLSTVPARERESALAAGAIAFMLNDWVEERFVLSPPSLLDCKEGFKPESAAMALRQHWGLGERPIRNLVHLLEAKGVRVFSLRENSKSIDAFSLWRRDIPYVFLNTYKTPERSRFDAAHELGHLTLHKHGGAIGGGRTVEDQANQFASAFLMPESSVRARLQRVQSLDQIVTAKEYWGVSAAALNYRLHKLGMTSEYVYRGYCIQLVERYRNEEPNGIARETSMLWDKVFTELRGDGINKHRIAQDLSLPVPELENLVFQLTRLQSIEGAGLGSGIGRAKLEVIPPPGRLAA
jgi:Zn-dependent peptidase ImmA (M78 family)/DNA-binding XRE family transcriptional regulator